MRNWNGGPYMDKFVERQEALTLLNAPTPEERLANLAILLEGEAGGKAPVCQQSYTHHLFLLPLLSHSSHLLCQG